MRWIIFFMLILVGALLQAGNLLNLMALGQWHIRPAPMVILLVYFAVQCRMREALIASFLIGLMMDMTGSQMGPHTISYCLAGGLLCQVSEHFPFRRYFQQAIVLLLVCLTAEMLAYWLGAAKTGEWYGYAGRIILLTAIYSACVGPFVWRVLRRLDRLIAITPPSPGRGGN